MPKKASKTKKSKQSKPRIPCVKISSDMQVSEVLSVHPESLAIFASVDLACLGDSDQQEMSVKEWVASHEIYDVKRFVQKLNKAASSRHTKSRKSHAHKGL